MILIWGQLVEKCVNNMKNLKEIKLMIERLESPRLTDTELQREKSLLKGEETSHDIRDRLHSFIDELAALLSGWYLSYDMKPEIKVLNGAV